MRGSDTARHEHSGDHFDAVPAIGRRGCIGNLARESAGGSFENAAIQLAAAVAVEFSAVRIGGLVVHIRRFERARVDPGDVPAAMRDDHRILRRGGIQVGDGERATLGGLRIVVHEADHPLTRSNLGRTIAESALDGGDRAQVAVDVFQIAQAGGCNVGVGIDEAGHDGGAAKVNLFCTGGGQAVDLGPGADRKKPSARD